LATDYQVNQDGSGDFTTIEAAIDTAVDGDVIVVHQGTYYENIGFQGKNIILRSEDPEDEDIVASTVIDGRQKRSVVTFSGTEGETCLLSGLTITNGRAYYAGGTPHYGGGICGGIYGAMTLAGIRNCTISGNSAEAFGGGALSHCGGTITNCTISGNSANWGGGLYWCDGTISNCTISGNLGGMGGGLYDCAATISNCTISGNSALTGGGLWYCTGTISKCTISDNSATGDDVSDGGGLCLCDGTISNCMITGNSATGMYAGGGGLSECGGTISDCTISGNSAEYYAGGLSYCDGTISDCTITGNSLTGEFSFAGGLYNCWGTISNSMISGNLAQWWGGGLFNCAATISNCTISDNSAGEEGGGLYQCAATISSCIVWGNEAPTGPELFECGYTVMAYSCVRGWDGGGQGNITDDPLFISGPLGDYYLSCRAAGQAADSPCLDAGSGTAESLGLDKLTTRTDGVPDAGIVDIGYHYPTAQEQNPYIQCSLNSGEFAPGDMLVGFMEAQNPGPDITIDAYVAFVLPNGAVVSLTAGGLTFGTYAWVANVVLPSGFDFGPSEVLRTTVPQSPGDYLFAAALTNPGRLEFIGEPSLFPFTILE